MSSKKFFIKGARLLLITTLMLFGVETFVTIKMKQVTYGNVGKINAILNNTIDSDITIWGASTAEGNFIPNSISNKINKSVFNVGLDGTNIDQYGGLLEEYIENNDSSKTIIIALDIHGGLMKRNKPYQLYNWLHVIENERIWNSLYDVNSTVAKKLKYLPFYSLIHYSKHNVKYLKPSKGDIFLNNGYVPRFGQMQKEHQVEETLFSNDQQVLKKLKRISVGGIKKGHKVFVVLTPCYYKGLSAGLNTEKILSSLSALKEEGIVFLDYSNHKLNRDIQYFKDHTHLNNVGAQEFSNAVSDTLLKLENH